MRDELCRAVVELDGLTGTCVFLKGHAGNHSEAETAATLRALDAMIAEASERLSDVCRGGYRGRRARRALRLAERIRGLTADLQALERSRALLIADVPAEMRRAVEPLVAERELVRAEVRGASPEKPMTTAPLAARKQAARAARG